MRALLPALAVLVVGCSQPMTWSPPTLNVSGRVVRYGGSRFLPAAGVRVAAAFIATTTDSAGRYTLLGLSPGPAAIGAGDETQQVTTTLALSAPVTTGINFVLLPERGEPGVAVVAGVITDPNGVALPGGTVQGASAASSAADGLADRADEDGFYAITLPLTAFGAMTLTASGRTADGLGVETTDLATVAIGPGLVTAWTARTTRWQPVADPASPTVSPTPIPLPTRDPATPPRRG